MTGTRDIQRAFAGIRAFCNGDHVPSPPRYFNDPGDILDFHRAAAWVTHALFAPDSEGDNVVQIVLFETDHEATVEIPSLQILSEDTRHVDAASWDVHAMNTVLSTCTQILANTKPEDQYETGRKRYEGMTRQRLPMLADKIIEKITACLESQGGRLTSDDDGWPAPSDAQIARANRIISGMVKTLSGGRMDSVCTSRLSPVNVISYPVKGSGPCERRDALNALERVSNAINYVVKAYEGQGRQQRYEAEQKRQHDEAQQEIAKRTGEILETHADALSTQGPAGEAILSFLKDGKPLPAHKSTVRFPRPERDALIDDLHTLLGEGAHEILKGTIAPEPADLAKGLRKLQYRLDRVLAQSSPAPSA